jgi:hypothetical protein
MVVDIQGSWVIPKVAASEGNSYSSAWIGIGGQTDSTLIQIGSQHDFWGGKERYTLWYELLPDNAITIPHINVTPGDEITAAITLTNGNANEWLIKITDDTTGQSFSKTVFYDSSRLSAEWIVERPVVFNQITTLANFSSITFTDIHAQIGQTIGAITAFPNCLIHMEDHQSNRLTAISDFSKDGSAFTINYAP